MMITVLNALKQELANRVSSIQIESGELVLTPYDYPDGETVSLLVRQLDGDLYLVSDLGLAAARLDEAGVDITRGGGHRSWKLLTADLSAPAAEANEYEIAAVADEQSLGTTMIRIGQAAIHSDALQAVHGRRRPHSFKERSMKRAAGFNLAVRPGAEIAWRIARDIKSRWPSCSIAGVWPCDIALIINKTLDHLVDLEQGRAA